MSASEVEAPLERSLLLHLLTYRGAQVRFEADQRTTEFGIFRSFDSEDATRLRTTLHQLEMRRLVYRRMQYVIGYSEPKLVYSLTPSGHRIALHLSHSQGFAASPSAGAAEDSTDPPVPGMVSAKTKGARPG